ncbi:PH domain-containing protein [Marinobacteraceae bacterium S3BR75-40.1]
MQRFDAPWGRTLKIVSGLATAVCLGITLSLWEIIATEGPESMHFWGGLLPVLLVAMAGLFTIRGYGVDDAQLLVRRLFWQTRLSLGDLEKVEVCPGELRQSLRLFGNGGLFSFSGLFRHKKLGRFRAFVTDWDRTVVLHFPDRRLVVSPANPERFVDALRLAHPHLITS